jgi:glutaminyl-peptide cyclotransferase
MNKKIIAATFLAVFGSVLWSCEPKPKKEETTTTATEKPEPVKLESPAFNADSAYKYTAAQVAFGPRVPNTEAHVKCGDLKVWPSTAKC